MAEGKLRVDGEQPVWLEPAGAPDGTRVFLGSTPAGPRFAVLVDQPGRHR